MVFLFHENVAFKDFTPFTLKLENIFELDIENFTLLADRRGRLSKVFDLDNFERLPKYQTQYLSCQITMLAILVILMEITWRYNIVLQSMIMLRSSLSRDSLELLERISTR